MTDDFDAVRRLDPEIHQEYLALASASERGHLDPLTRTFVCLAVHASVTTRQEAAVRQHIQDALRLGASRAELIEVLEVTSVLGVHSATVGLPILAAALAKRGQPLERELTDLQATVREAYIDGRGNWSAFHQDWVRLHPNLMQAYLQYSTVPWRRGALSPKVKELLYIAIDAQTTHLYQDGIRLHIDNALALGVTAEEIADVLAILCTLGFRACAMAFPILEEELLSLETEQTQQ